MCLGKVGWVRICIGIYDSRERCQLRRHMEQEAGVTFECVDVSSAVDLVKFKRIDAIRLLFLMLLLIFSNHQLGD